MMYDLRVMIVWVYDFMEFLASTRNNVCLAICCVATSLDWCPQNTTKQQKTNKKTSLGQKSSSWLHEENRTKTCTYVKKNRMLHGMNQHGMYQHVCVGLL